MDFIIEVKSVYSAVLTGALNKAVCALSLNVGEQLKRLHTTFRTRRKLEIKKCGVFNAAASGAYSYHRT
jgi:hypothetical protein